ncbi:phenylalanine ammonia-lyase [Cladophialophora psammophila CBS 110553]|uniref:Phenylalanine ammonia-lyase n=1 Tax=Cladophialophora psammophila CBS 110553 TaxID=1182543 RepID=W9WU47_9EURO|nr:phenylalanine ammonia-lyase [Cladophialophora psammophila CBS 110553]EXJ68181.1 phenylalanine ammonia-lyase [Cladophialophora psammophila CBS 110553]
MTVNTPSPGRARAGKRGPTPHLNATLELGDRVQTLVKEGEVEINGHELDIATVVAVSRFGCKPFIEQTPKLVDNIEAGQDILEAHLESGSKLYGINTGFGGNADLRTNALVALQRALIQHQQSAVLTGQDLGAGCDGQGETTSHSMPSGWVKGAMLIRCNTNIRGHSAISLQVADTLVEFVRRDMTPVVPLRGSISASGDLMPLSYIAGALQGNPDTFVRTGKGKDSKVVNAREAFKEIQRLNVEEAKHGKQLVNGRSIEYSPVVLGPKEGLALVNGTAPSAAVACLAMYEANHLVVLSQLITCLTSEALAGNVEWTHPYIAEIRPHPGQIEVSQNQRSFFEGSKLVDGLDHANRYKEGIVQDRYSTRTSSQWVGPLLEDLLHACEQLKVELNSTTDNPIVDLKAREIHCGGNFQATTVTMVAERIRLCLQMIGKMLFAQTSELVNPAFNNGLPPNLAPDDPSLSFCAKGVDINMAAYQSELAFLANPVSSHVQSAEMHNQGINSLALVSARYAMQSVEIVQLMSASAIWVGLQGVDLRTMHMTFLAQFKDVAKAAIAQTFESWAGNDGVQLLTGEIWAAIRKTWYATANSDAVDRCEQVAKATVEPILNALDQLPLHHHGCHPERFAREHKAWVKTLQKIMYNSFLLHRASFFDHPTTPEYLGKGTKVLYRFVREELGVPFYRGQVEDPVLSQALNERPVKTIGSWISVIYAALRDGSLYSAVLKPTQKAAVTSTATTTTTATAVDGSRVDLPTGK